VCLLNVGIRPCDHDGYSLAPAGHDARGYTAIHQCNCRELPQLKHPLISLTTNISSSEVHSCHSWRYDYPQNPLFSSIRLTSPTCPALGCLRSCLSRRPRHLCKRACKRSLRTHQFPSRQFPHRSSLPLLVLADDSSNTLPTPPDPLSHHITPPTPASNPPPILRHMLPG